MTQGEYDGSKVKVYKTFLCGSFMTSKLQFYDK